MPAHEDDGVVGGRGRGGCGGDGCGEERGGEGGGGGADAGDVAGCCAEVGG